MYAYRRAASSALVLLALVGCARMPVMQPLSRNVAPAIQPVDVKIGISQPELYASFELSRAGQSAAAACGSVPGLGIFLAAACGAAAGAVDASVNASRAKAADEIIRPLKDEIVDLKFDQLMNESVTKSLQTVPGMQISLVSVTKTVDNKAYEQALRASASGAVMFVNVDYNISKDFSTLNVSARGLVYPRSDKARVAAGLPANLASATPVTAPSNTSASAGAVEEPVMSLKNTVYRASVYYHAVLPKQSDSPSGYIAAWKADNGRVLRASINDGIAQVTRLLAEDLQREPGAERKVLSEVEVDKNLKADLLAEANGSQLLRYRDGSLHFKVTLSAVAAASLPVDPLKATASTAIGKTAAQ